MKYMRYIIFNEYWNVNYSFIHVNIHWLDIIYFGGCNLNVEVKDFISEYQKVYFLSGGENFMYRLTTKSRKHTRKEWCSGQFIGS